MAEKSNRENYVLDLRNEDEESNLLEIINKDVE
jgi:hypothetical protein